MTSAKDLIGDFKNKATALTTGDFEIVVDTKTSQLWILHDKSFNAQTEMKEVIYNEEEATFSFISAKDSIQELPVNLKESTKEAINKAKEITAIHTKKGEILDIFVVPFTIK